ncbi:MAG: aminopeptidase [Prosthecobacter sp.]
MIFSVPRTLWLACALVLCSCRSIGFYSQAIRGQVEIWRRQRPVEAVLADPAEKEAVKAKLRLALELREYAKNTLKLPAESFATYSDLKRPYVVWVVYATEPFSVEPKQWWYPFVGRLAYRGFFDQEDARKEVLSLQSKGQDVFAAGVEAYSTLGFFKDPLLNTCIHRSEAELAEIIFHELTHARLFIPGDTEFNEAFATAMAETAVRRWLRSKGRVAELQAYEAHLKRDRAMIALALGTRAELKKLYATPEHTLQQKNAVLSRLQSRLAAMGVKDKATHVKNGKEQKIIWNNARLNTLATYHDLVPGFERLLRESQSDVEAFYTAVEKLKPLPKDDRRRLLMAALND